MNTWHDDYTEALEIGRHRPPPHYMAIGDFPAPNAIAFPEEDEDRSTAWGAVLVGAAILGAVTWFGIGYFLADIVWRIWQ